MANIRPPKDAPATFGDLLALFDKVIERDEAMRQNFMARDDHLRSQMIDLFARTVDNRRDDEVLINGFSKVAESIVAQTGPLRNLGREYGKLAEGAGERLDQLVVALKRQSFDLSVFELPTKSAPPAGGDRSTAA